MENTVIIMCLWLVSGISTGLIATVKGRSPILWFLLGAVGGVIAIPVLVSLKSVGGGLLRAQG